ncbi:MAG: type I phosphomannose isomerase catalytic subunit [Anaerolineae bacterium]
MIELAQLIQLEPQYRDYVWGGQRLRPGMLTAEAWIIYDGDRVANGPLAGRTLAEIAAEHGAALLGEAVIARSGGHFPLLIKLLDCAQWLSLQVHPNDRQAVELEGPGHFGKTEAWHVLDAAPKAQLIAGLKPGATREAVAAALRGGAILDWAQYRDVHTGDTLLIDAGTIHAIGPGLMIYEVQQASDLTYRVFDWNRPQTGGRALHIDKSIAVADPVAQPQTQPRPRLGDGEQQILCQSVYFTLELLAAESQVIRLDTRNRSFHALTVIDGEAEVRVGEETIALARFQSVIVPAAAGPYEVRPRGAFQALKSSVE